MRNDDLDTVEEKEFHVDVLDMHGFWFEREATTNRWHLVSTCEGRKFASVNIEILRHALEKLDMYQKECALHVKDALQDTIKAPPGHVLVPTLIGPVPFPTGTLLGTSAGGNALLDMYNNFGIKEEPRE